MKKIAAALLVLVALIGGALWWLSSNIDGLVKDAVEKYGSDMTQARVGVGAVKISSSDGKGTISDLSIGNPAGFKTAHALKVGRIEIEIDIASVTSDVVVIRRIAIVAPGVIYEKGEAMTNFDAIQKNIAAYLGAAAGKKDAKQDGKKAGKKLIVDLIEIRSAKAEASAAFMNGKTISVPLPDITLKGIGRAKGGVPPGEVGQEVIGALKASLGAAVSFDNLMKSAGDALGKAGAAVKALFK